MYLILLRLQLIILYRYIPPYRSRLPHGDGLLVYFTDDPRGRYNYSGEFEEGEISPFGGGITFYRNGDSYEGDYSGQGDAKGLPEGRGVLR